MLFGVITGSNNYPYISSQLNRVIVNRSVDFEAFIDALFLFHENSTVHVLSWNMLLSYWFFLSCDIS